MAELVKKKVQASTLLEVLISMIIIMIIFSLAIGIYTRITTSGISLADKQIQQQMQQILMETKREKDWKDKSFTINEVDYNRTVSAYKGYSDLFLLTIEANQNGKSKGMLQEVVREVGDEH